MRRSQGIIGVIFVQALAGCDATGSSRVPMAPSSVTQTPPPVPQPAPIQLALFTDPSSGVSTSDLRDVDEQIVQVNTADELIWTADGTRFPEFIAVGNFIAYHHGADTFFQVRFGTKDGERRAYLGWRDDRLRGRRPTILDLWVDGRGDLKIAETDVPVPGT